jgi:PhnB protein
MKLIPYLHFAGNAQEVIDFYKRALGGEATINRYGDSPMQVDEDYKDKIVHARYVFDGNMIMISDSFKGQPISTKGNIQLSVEADSEEQLRSAFEKLSEGGKVTMPLAKQYWGALFGMLEDKFGVSWMFNYEMSE